MSPLYNFWTKEKRWFWVFVRAQNYPPNFPHALARHVPYHAGSIFTSDAGRRASVGHGQADPRRWSAGHGCGETGRGSPPHLFFTNDDTKEALSPYYITKFVVIVSFLQGTVSTTR